MRKLFLLLTIFLNLFSGTHGIAKIRLPELIGDKMVLQRDIPLTIWGWADVGEKVTVRFQGNHYLTEAGQDGKWIVQLPPHPAGGPYIIEVNELIIRDVLIGDVWLASGQSNMETPIARLTDRYPEINVSNNHMIRSFKVPTQNSVESLQESIQTGGKWHSGVASEVINWTALAYFYAQEAYSHTHVPVGIIVSSLGGSAIESWISQEHLKKFPNLLVDQEAIIKLDRVKIDQGSGKWNAYDWNDLDWQIIKVPELWSKQDIGTKGIVYFRRDFEIPPSMEGRHMKLLLGTLIDSDSVFVNGQFVGSTSYQYPPRKYDIPAGILKSGKNNITVQLTLNNDFGGFVPDKSYKIVGDEFEVDLRGEWRYKVGLKFDDIHHYKNKLLNIANAGSGLYNGMIFPIKDYAVRGVIWYQGESNAGRPQHYQVYLESLIRNWRELYHLPTLPFLIVQLPNYLKKQADPQESGWAEIRESQLKATQTVPHTGLVVTYDIGEWNDIHPLNKKDLAYRLFLQARSLSYNEKLVSSGPQFQSMKIEGDNIILSFTNIGEGLRSRDRSLKHFAIAGDDRKFVWADALIKGNTVIVSSPRIKKPVAVRYGWSDNPEDANLVNDVGLLTSPFRTDDW